MKLDIKKLSEEEKRLSEDTKKRIFLFRLETEDFNKIKDILSDNTAENQKILLISELDENIKKTTLQKLKEINKTIISPILFKLLDHLKSLDIKESELETKEINTEKKTDDSIEEIGKILPEDQISKEYVNEDKKTISAIDISLENLHSLNTDEIYIIEKLKKELQELKKTLNEQNRLIKKIDSLLFSTPLQKNIIKLMLKNIDIPTLIEELKSSIAKEITVHNSMLREFAEIRIQDESSRLNELIIFENKNQELSLDLEMLSNQFIDPSIQLNKDFVTYQCSFQELLRILKTDKVINALPIYNYELYSCGISFRVRFHNFAINPNIPDNKEITLIFPLEKITKGRVFQHTDKFLRIFAPKEINSFPDKKTFEKLIITLKKDMEEKKTLWIKNSKKLDSLFDKKFSDKAETLIDKGFTEKWMSECSTEFSLKNKIDIKHFILSLIIGSETGINIQDAEIKLKESDHKSFIKLIDNSLANYQKSIEDIKILAKSKQLTIDDSIMMIPKKHILYFEKQFSTTGRPNVIYYENLNKKIRSLTVKDEINQKKDRPKNLNIFIKKDMIPLQFI